MKLYYRIAKKYIWWSKLNKARNLKPGDIIATCTGWNQAIDTIEPRWYNGDTASLRGKLVVDFRISTTDGTSHSWINCCNKAETREEIIAYWMEHDTEEYKKWYMWCSGQTGDFYQTGQGKFVLAIKNGEEVLLNENWND